MDMDNLLKQLVRGKALLFIVVLGLGGCFQIGCHNTLISSPSPYIKRFINSSWTQRYGEAPGENTVTFIWSAIVSIFAFGGLVGSISVRWVSNQLGRKKAMIWNNAINVVALCIMIACRPANSFEMILIARFLFGFTSGLGGSLHVLYLGESSPKKIRGMVTFTVATFKAVGKMTGQFAGLSEILGRENWWNILLGVPAFFSIIQMVTLPFFPEPPRYLLIEKGNAEQCKKALQCLWGPGEYKLEIEEMLVEQAALKGERSKTLLELLKDQSARWQLLTMFVVNGAIQFSGVSAITVFSFSIFEEAGIPVDKIRYVTLGVGVSEILTNITCGLLIDRVGRRVLLWGGFGSMAIIMALITLTLELKEYSFWIPYSTVCLIFLFVICFGGGPAGVIPSLSHEIFVQSYRSAAFVFIGILMWVSFSVLGFIFPFLLAALKSYSFILFSCTCLGASLFIYFILPETKGKTSLEITEDFRNIRLCGSSTDDICLETRL
ncbi:solute carrier family 2, facilitated glucose transporter member 9-like [Salminus brasiliensis]|uniref:solute carrier family 2, facilitated glucose transporter member 9-like n=1 Tax=Salminus brasiliensis TaxID=930266 RepID=UPI003B836027